MEWCLSEMKKRYSFVTVNGATWFTKPNGRLFALSRLGHEDPWNCYVIEHAASLDELIGAEDGGLFYPEDYSDKESMLEDMIQEVSL